MHTKNKNHSLEIEKARQLEQAQTAEQSQNTAVFEEAIWKWSAPRFLRYPRGKGWFVGVFCMCLILVGYSIQTQAWSTLAVFALLPVVLLLEHRHKPENVEVVISAYGIRYGTLKIPYSQVKSFWIAHHPPMVDELHLHIENYLIPELVVPLMGQDPALIRQFMVTQAREWEGKNLSVIDVLIRLLRLN